MFDSIKKIKIFHKKPEKISYEKTGLRPKEDWIKVVSITMVVLFLGVLFNFYFYNQISNGLLFKAEYEKPNVTVLNKQALDRVVNTMEQKQIIVDEIRANRGSIIDPAR